MILGFSLTNVYTTQRDESAVSSGEGHFPIIFLGSSARIRIRCKTKKFVNVELNSREPGVYINIQPSELYVFFETSIVGRAARKEVVSKNARSTGDVSIELRVSISRTAIKNCRRGFPCSNAAEIRATTAIQNTQIVFRGFERDTYTYTHRLHGGLYTDTPADASASIFSSPINLQTAERSSRTEGLVRSSHQPRFLYSRMKDSPTARHRCVASHLYTGGRRKKSKRVHQEIHKRGRITAESTRESL